MRVWLIVLALLLAGCSKAPDASADLPDPEEQLQQIIADLNATDWRGVHIPGAGSGAAVAMPWNDGPTRLELQFLSEPTGFFLGWFGLRDGQWHYAGGTAWRHEPDPQRHDVFIVGMPGPLGDQRTVDGPDGKTSWIFEDTRPGQAIPGPTVDADEWMIIVGARENGDFTMALRGTSRTAGDGASEASSEELESAIIAHGPATDMDIGILHIENLGGQNHVSNRGLTLTSTTPVEQGAANARTITGNAGQSWMLVAHLLATSYAHGSTDIAGSIGGQSIASTTQQGPGATDAAIVASGEGDNEWSIEHLDAGGWLVEQYRVMEIHVPGGLSPLLGAPVAPSLHRT